MTEAGHQMESSSNPSQSSAPQSFVPTNPNLIDTSSEAHQHDESNASSTDDRSDHDSRGSGIPTPEGETSGTYTPSQLLMAIFVAVVVFLILAVYQGILYIPGVHPITAALATVSICTAITSQPSFLGRFIYLILYAIGFMAKVIETSVHGGYARGSESHSRSSSRQRGSGSSSPKPRPAVPKKSSRISSMKI